MLKPRFNEVTLLKGHTIRGHSTRGSHYLEVTSGRIKDRLSKKNEVEEVQLNETLNVISNEQFKLRLRKYV